MKSVLKKINLPALLTFVLGLGIMSGSLAKRSAFAGRTDVVPALQVKVSKGHMGRYLQVIYAVGRPGAIGVSPVPILDIIRPQSQSLLINSEVLNFPSVELEKTPGRGSYNMIVFAVSDVPAIKWVNEDELAKPTGPTSVYLSKKNKSDIDTFLGQKPSAPFLQINL